MMCPKIMNNHQFQTAIVKRIKAGDDFKTMLNQVCSAIMSYQLYLDDFNLGGFSLDHAKSNATPFELVCFDMLEKFEGELSHFRYVFMDTWVIVSCFAI